MTIERNLNIVNVSPPRPTRVCRKITGPPSCSLIGGRDRHSTGEIDDQAEGLVSMTSLARLSSGASP